MGKPIIAQPINDPLSAFVYRIGSEKHFDIPGAIYIRRGYDGRHHIVVQQRDVLTAAEARRMARFLLRAAEVTEQLESQKTVTPEK